MKTRLGAIALAVAITVSPAHAQRPANTEDVTVEVMQRGDPARDCGCRGGVNNRRMQSDARPNRWACRDCRTPFPRSAGQRQSGSDASQRPLLSRHPGHEPRPRRPWPQIDRARIARRPSPITAFAWSSTAPRRNRSTSRRGREGPTPIPTTDRWCWSDEEENLRSRIRLRLAHPAFRNRTGGGRAGAYHDRGIRVPGHDIASRLDRPQGQGLEYDHADLLQ